MDYSQCTTISTFLGELLIAGDGQALKTIIFQRARGACRLEPLRERGGGLVEEAARQLAAYLKGKLRAFDLPLAPDGTPFQLAAWRALQQIPYGETISYGEQAAAMGRPSAARAVGAANGRNPLPIVIPCHRVIGKSGALVGFGGGLDLKRRLLDLERRSSRRAPLDGAPASFSALRSRRRTPAGSAPRRWRGG